MNKKLNLLKVSLHYVIIEKMINVPPWSIQAKKMIHDQKKKTVYYDNAVIKVYDFPIFFLPKLSHPDPTVDRRSGFLIPSFSDSKNLGSGLIFLIFGLRIKIKILL